MTAETVFTETQRFNQWWIYLIAIGSMLLVTGAMAMLLLAKLETRIDGEGVHLKFFPLKWHERHIPWSEVKSAYFRTYSPVSEYGGWGIKGSRGNRAWNVSGYGGLQLELRDGSKLLVGTLKRAELEEALKRVGPNGK